jgi:hypothetical protein
MVRFFYFVLRLNYLNQQIHFKNLVTAEAGQVSTSKYLFQYIIHSCGRIVANIFFFKCYLVKHAA